MPKGPSPCALPRRWQVAGGEQAGDSKIAKNLLTKESGLALIRALLQCSLAFERRLIKHEHWLALTEEEVKDITVLKFGAEAKPLKQLRLEGLLSPEQRERIKAAREEKAALRPFPKSSDMVRKPYKMAKDGYVKTMSAAAAERGIGLDGMVPTPEQRVEMHEEDRRIYPEVVEKTLPPVVPCEYCTRTTTFESWQYLDPKREAGRTVLASNASIDAVLVRFSTRGRWLGSGRLGSCYQSPHA